MAMISFCRRTLVVAAVQANDPPSKALRKRSERESRQQPVERLVRRDACGEFEELRQPPFVLLRRSRDSRGAAGSGGDDREDQIAVQVQAQAFDGASRIVEIAQGVERRDHVIGFELRLPKHSLRDEVRGEGQTSRLPCPPRAGIDHPVSTPAVRKRRRSSTTQRSAQLKRKPDGLVAAIRSDCSRRYSVGLTPVQRRNARRKADLQE